MKEAKGRPEMLPETVSYYDQGGRIPDRIRVSFSDGSTAVYELHVDQPAPLIRESIRIIQAWNTGYQYQPKRRRRAGR